MSWTYLIVLIIFYFFLRIWGDDWWLATLMLFGPIWVTALPLAVLAPTAALVSRRSLVALALAAYVAFFLLIDVCVPWRPLIHPHRLTQHLRILTCNVHGKVFDGPALGQLIEQSGPDVILLQEAWVARQAVAPFAGDVRWHWRRDGELAIASRYPISSAEDFGDPRWSKWGGACVRYHLAAPGGEVCIFNIHLASPHTQFQAVIDQKSDSTEILEEHLAVRSQQSQKLSVVARAQGGNMMLGGDFNTICEGSIYRESWAQFADAFTTAGLGIGHTYFAEGAAIRIDHVMSGSQWRCRRCRVGPDVGSPHRPLIADMEWIQTR